MSVLKTLLAYMGTLPFVAGAVLISLGIEQLFFINDMTAMVNSYGLIIVVFMSGIHWGNYISDNKCNSINLLLTSNVITLISWFAFLFTPAEGALIIYCIAFLTLLYIDSRLLLLKVITHHYYKLRFSITSIVIISLLWILFSLIN